MKQRNQTSRRFTGFLDSGTSFTGDLDFEGTLRIDGVVDGSVRTPDVLIVGPSAVIRANVDAGAVQVHGHVVGDVSCTHRLELCSEGRIDGNIDTPHLVVEAGATFDGRSQMTGARQTAAEPPTERREPAKDSSPAHSAPDNEEDSSGGLETQPTRWQNLARRLESTGLRPFSTAPSDSE